MTPVRPPSTKMKMKPKTKCMAAVMRRRPVHKVASQQKIWTPLVIAIIMLAAVKYASPICGRPVANMWCTQSPKAMKAVADQRKHHGRIAENCAAGVGVDDGGDQSRARE